jgi:hypothetical protein
MAYVSTESVDFQQTVERWIDQSGEILVLVRFSHAGGSRSFEFFTSIEAFRERLHELQAKTGVIVFAERQLPLRGRVDEAFIARAIEMIHEGQDFMVAGLDKTVIGKAEYYDWQVGDTREELREYLTDCLGKRVAFGPYPPWLEDSDTVTSAVVPYPDGRVEGGVY